MSISGHQMTLSGSTGRLEQFDIPWNQINHVGGTTALPNSFLHHRACIQQQNEQNGGDQFSNVSDKGRAVKTR